MNPKTAEKISFFRRFNREFATRIRLFDTGGQGENLSPAAVRMLWETERLAPCSPSQLSTAMRVDPAYTSRILKELKAKKLLLPAAGKTDRRVQTLELSSKGKKALNLVAERIEGHLDTLLGHLSPDDQVTLFAAMKTILRFLDEEPPAHPVLIRTRQLGDVGRVLYLHGMCYGYENNFGTRLEAHVARDLAELDNPTRASRSELWVAEADGNLVGSLGILDRGRDTAQLHWLLVKQNYRGRGIAKQLVNTAIDFCRRHGFRRIRLETTEALTAARRLYQDQGFKRVSSEEKTTYGPAAVVETWQLEL